LQTPSASHSTEVKNLKLDYSGQRRFTKRGLLMRTDLLASGVEHVNHFGNETPETDDGLSRTHQDQFLFFPSLRLERGSRFEAFLGAEVPV
jgi:hypothetical protein